MNYISIDTLDINTIEKDKVFAIDTNVLYWTHYSQASNPNLVMHPYQVQKYPDFIAKLIENGNTLVTTVLNITELVHLVERSQFRIYNENRPKSNRIKFKDFRNIEAEREKYKNEIGVIIEEIKASYDNQIKVIDISMEKIDEFKQSIDKNKVDAFDYLIIEYLKKNGITSIVSDDKDFCTIDGVDLYSTCES